MFNPAATNSNLHVFSAKTRKLLLGAIIVQIAIAIGPLLFDREAAAFSIIVLAASISGLYSYVSGRFRWIPIAINTVIVLFYAVALILFLTHLSEVTLDHAIMNTIFVIAIIAVSLAICVLVLKLPLPQIVVDYDNPEAVLAAASRLEREGEWDQAISLYGRVFEKWPREHGQYAANCIADIERKMAVARAMDSSA